ncbi:hypothetical protein ACQEU5_07150 [Marinactinospora thermotolerans]|uniref:hypothetical protein n=1 Tax=Marinactinospora thermotolerans TaxID=531310 RepID=UPI003D900837
MAASTKTRSRKKKPSAAAIAAAEAVIQREQQEAASRARWSAEGVAGWVWERLAHPAPGTLRGMYKHVFTPWYWGGGVTAAIAVQEAAAVAAGGPSAASLALVAAGSAATANLAPRLLRSRWAARTHPHAADWVAREPGHARLTANAAALGATAVHALGWAGHTPDTLALAGAAGLFGFLGVGARYWQYHRHHTVVRRPGLGQKIPAVASTADGMTEEALAPDVFGRLTQRWRVVSAPGKVLSGAELLDPVPQPYGGLARIRLTEDQEASVVMSQIGRIAAALRIPAGQIDLSPHEPDEGEPDPSILTIRVISSVIMRRPVPLDDGRSRVVVDAQGRTLLRVGRYVDGDGEVYWLLYDGASMWSGYIGGVTGSGKSSLSDAVFLGMLETGCTYTIYIDPKGGQSSPRIADSCHWFVGSDPTDWEAVIDGLIAVIKARGKLLAYQGSSGFQPSPEMPGICLIFDEFYEVAKASPALPEKMAWLARKGRSVGVTAMLLTQGYGLDDFGGVDAVRSNVGVANAFALKLKANQGSIFARDFPHLPNPALLPETEDRPQNKGLAVALKGRNSVLRTAWSPAGRTSELITTARSATIDHLDPYSADALDEGSAGLFGRRHELAEAEAAATEAEIAERTQRGRTLISGEPVRDRPRTQQTALAGKDPATTATAAGRTAPPAMPDRVLVDLEAWRRGEHRDTAVPESPAAAAVLRLLAERGPLGTQQIIDALAGRPGCGSTAIKAVLPVLAETDRIAKGSSRKSPWALL